MIKVINFSNACCSSYKSAQVARGILEEDDVKKMHEKMEHLLSKDGAKLDGIYYCPHHPGEGITNGNPKYIKNCNCRKPKPGMYLKAKEDLGIDLKNSVYIGDTTRYCSNKKIGGTSFYLELA